MTEGAQVPSIHLSGEDLTDITQCVDFSKDDSQNELPSSNEDSKDKEHFAKVAATKMSFKAPQWWMLIFGNILAACAGSTNTTAFKCTGSFATHVTGFVSTAAVRLEEVHKSIDEPRLGNGDMVCVQIACFFTGSYLCGLIIPKPQVSFGRQALYGAALMATSLLLFVTAFKNPSDISLLYTASMAAGLQNAMCSLHFGAVVRTTHLTGTTTDIASTLGRITVGWVRHWYSRTSWTQLEKAELGISYAKLLVLAPIFCSFFGGSYLGTVLFTVMGHWAFLVPAVITGAAGIAYSMLRDKLRRTFQVWQMATLETELGEVEHLLQHSLACFKRHSMLASKARQQPSRQSTEADLDIEGAVGHLQAEVLHIRAIMQEVEAELEMLDEDFAPEVEEEGPTSPLHGAQPARLEGP